MFQNLAIHGPCSGVRKNLCLIPRPTLPVYFRFWKQYRRHIGILPPVSILTMCRQPHVILLRLTKFHPNWTIYGWVMTSYRYSSGHGVGNLLLFPVRRRLALEKVKDYLHTKFRQDISIHGLDITTSVFWKQTASVLKFYIRFPFWCVCRHWNAILHWWTKFHPNRTTYDWVMTSYRFSKTAAAASGIYFRFPVRWRLAIEKVKDYPFTKFRQDI